MSERKKWEKALLRLWGEGKKEGALYNPTEKRRGKTTNRRSDENI